LQALQLSFNRICGVEEVHRLGSLHALNLESNRLAGSPSLDLPPSLCELRVAQNAMISLGGVASQMPALHSVDVSCNSLESTVGLQLCPALALAVLEDNRISDFDALKSLESLRNLLVLDLSGNPVTKLDKYRLEVLYPLLTNGVSLDTLDKLPVLAEEKVASLNLYGAADEELAEIREKYFPTLEVQQERRDREAAVLSVQAQFRGFAERKAVKLQQDTLATSATAIQTRIRGRKARQSVSVMYDVPATMLA